MCARCDSPALACRRVVSTVVDGAEQREARRDGVERVVQGIMVDGQ